MEAHDLVWALEGSFAGLVWGCGRGGGRVWGWDPLSDVRMRCI